MHPTWSPFAWQGIHLLVPSDWNPGKISGEHPSGSVRFDDSHIVRIEMEWKEARGDDRVGLIVDRYVEGLAKNAQKEKNRLEVERNATCPGLSLPDMRHVEYFIWRSRFIVYTLACYSPVSDRLLFVRISGRHDENLEAILPRLFNSLKDTSIEAPQSWALYDMTCVSPPGYTLDTFDLKSGHVSLKFLHKNTQLQIDRFSLAQIILKGRTLQDWFLDFFKKDLRHIHVTNTHAETTDNNQRLIVEGLPKSRLRALLQPLPFWNVRPRLYLTGRVWTDFSANKIFVVQTFWKKSEDPPDIDLYCQQVLPTEPKP